MKQGKEEIGQNWTTKNTTLDGQDKVNEITFDGKGMTDQSLWVVGCRPFDQAQWDLNEDNKKIVQHKEEEENNEKGKLSNTKPHL